MNHIDIWFEAFGKKENPALLLIMGGCCQGVMWDQYFCEKLASEGFYVIRYDHRDMGLSACVDFVKEPYDLMDMAKDAITVLDALKVKKAHLFGISMGAFIAELVGAYYPERVHALVLMSATCDMRPMNLAYANLPPEKNASLPPPSTGYLAWMKEFMKLSPQTDEEKLTQRLEGWNRLNGEKFPLNEEINRKLHSEFLSRLRYPEGIVNHILMLRDDRSENWLRIAPSKITIPTIILQGSEDPIFSPEHGKALSRAIKNSEYILVEGMGHVPSDHFYDLYIDVLKRQAGR